MNDMSDMRIRHATLDDLDAVARVESQCFPAAEAASRESLRDRIAAHPDDFWLLFANDTLIGFVNGMTTDRADLTDDMYDDVSLYDPQGDWLMIFGVDTAPEQQHRGYASRIMRQVIADAREQGRKGLVLTCKERLIGFYARFGFMDEGISDSTHGDVVWHQMRLRFVI